MLIIPKRKGTWLLFVLSVLLGFASISTDLYLPALPIMGAALGASQGTLEMTISGYLLGFSLGQLFWGPISDRFGRRLPLLTGLAMFVAASAGCAMASDAAALIGFRILQAVGASAGVVLARAMVRDLYDRDQSARVLSTLMTIMAVAPLLGPSIGGQILALSSWRAIFWTLVVIGVATLLAVATLGESHPHDQRQGGSPRAVMGRYVGLLKNRAFLSYAGVIGFFYAGIFAYVAGTPFAYIQYHNLSPQLYGLAFAAGTIGLMVTNVVNARLVARVGSDRLLLVGASGAALFGFGTAIVSATDLGGLPALAGMLFLYVSMNGLIAANSIAGALASVPSGTGTASALAGCVQYGGGVLGSLLVGLMSNGTPLPMGAVIVTAGLGTLGCSLWILNGRQPTALSL